MGDIWYRIRDRKLCDDKVKYKAKEKCVKDHKIPDCRSKKL